MQRMKESETIKEYSNKFLGIANKIKLLGKEFPDSRLIEKIPYKTQKICLQLPLHRWCIGDASLASTRTTKIDERRSWGG